MQKTAGHTTSVFRGSFLSTPWNDSNAPHTAAEAVALFTEMRGLTGAIACDLPELGGRQTAIPPIVDAIFPSLHNRAILHGS
jgi:hypothetical protein